MSKLNEAIPSSCLDVGTDEETEEKSARNEDRRQEKSVPTEPGGETTDKKMTEDEKQDILRFTMLFNKYNCDLDVKRSSRNDDDDRHKYTMFFNKEVTIRSNVELPPISKYGESKKLASFEKVDAVCDQDSAQCPNQFCFNGKFRARVPAAPEYGVPQLSEPEMVFSHSLPSSSPNAFDCTTQSTTEKLEAFLGKNPRALFESVELNVHPATRTDLRVHNSLTSLSKTQVPALKGVLTSKIPSLTALDLSEKKSACSDVGYWDHWEDLILVQGEKNKKFDLQISRSSNDNNRRSASKFKKEDAASVSDSKLLVADSDSKKQIKKNDKKSRGDSSKKEKDGGNRKQVQWKTEVDVIYFSTHLAANGDRSGEVIGRVMEPLREEWEQQRKGFYAKMVPSYMESHVKDRFISLLKI